MLGCARSLSARAGVAARACAAAAEGYVCWPKHCPTRTWIKQREMATAGVWNQGKCCFLESSCKCKGHPECACSFTAPCHAPGRPVALGTCTAARSRPRTSHLPQFPPPRMRRPAGSTSVRSAIDLAGGVHTAAATERVEVPADLEADVPKAVERLSERSMKGNEKAAEGRGKKGSVVDRFRQTATPPCSSLCL